MASGTLEETREALHSGASTSRALVESSLSRARGSEERLACFARLRGEAALAEGSQSDERRVQGDVLGPLLFAAGVRKPLAALRESLLQLLEAEHGYTREPAEAELVLGAYLDDTKRRQQESAAGAA